MKIGNRIILISETMFVQDGETLEIEREICSGDTLRLRISFPQDVEYEGGKNPVILYEFIADWFEFKFANFTTQFGSTTNHPTIFALTHKQEPISYMAAVYKFKSSTKIELQVMVEFKS